jgi:invasion protein IalB
MEWLASSLQSIDIIHRKIQETNPTQDTSTIQSWFSFCQKPIHVCSLPEMQYIKQKNAQKRGKLILIPARMFHSGTLVLYPSFQALQIAVAKTFSQKVLHHSSHLLGLMRIPD